MPMKKYFSTLFYSVQSFVSNDSDILEIDSLIEPKSSDFKDVYNLLEKSTVSPSNEVVDKILRKSTQLSKKGN